MVEIIDFKIRPAFTSRGDPTLEAEVIVRGGKGRATSPMGASAGKNEAIHLPKGGAKASIEILVSNKDKIIGIDAGDLKALSDTLKDIDGTEKFENIGAAAAYAITVASAEAEANSRGIPMYEVLIGKEKPTIPYPLGNVLGGGKHAGKGSPDIQEFLVTPLGAPNIMEAIKVNLEVHKKVRSMIEERDPTFSGGKGDEGAWAPRMTDEEAFEVVEKAIDHVSRELGYKIGFGIDMASSSLWENGKYVYRRKGKVLTSEEQLAYVEDLIKKYNLIYVEDPFHEEDFESFSKLTKRMKDVAIVGDDLFVTNVKRLEKGIKMKAANGVILKVNQVGTLYDALLFSKLAIDNGYKVVASHRSGDTWDHHLAHIAIGAKAWLIKTGIVGGERMSKLMELCRIWEGLQG